MAEDDFEPISEEPVESNKKKKNPLLLVGLLVLGGYFMFNSSSDENKNIELPKASTFNAEQANKDLEDEEKTREKVGGVEVSGGSKDRAVSVLAASISENTEKDKKFHNLVKQMVDNQTNFQKELETKIDKKLSKVTETLQEISENRVNNDFVSTQPGNRNDTNDLPIIDEEGKVVLPNKQSKHKGGFNYYVIGKKKNNNNSASPEPKKASDLLNFNPVKNDRDEAHSDDSTNIKRSTKNKDTKSKDDDDFDDELYEKYEISIAASSHAKVKVMHGARCPVGGSLSTDSVGSRTPVRFAIESAFYGPDGTEVDIGKMHLIGFCVGVRNGERARIKVQYLSYVGADNKQILKEVDGYIVDTRDHDIDIAGAIQTQRGRDIGLTALAETVGTVGTLTQQQQFNTVTNSDGDTQSNFAGSKSKAIGGAALSGAGSRVADMLAEDAASGRDVIHMPGGIIVIFNTLKPIEFTGIKFRDDIS